MDTLGTMVEESNVSAFLNNEGTAAQVASLVEDIRDATIHYQVHTPPLPSVLR
jgi:hypothetical protein